ncbi:MAG: AAA family ATPase, partial [Zetaproteobacteria bacterium]|nr:AAA family ATPase [Zetaproteobacteria bacterium]
VAAPRKRVSTGIAGLDKMLSGGLISGTTSMLTGPSGTGKTTSGMHFILDGTRQDEPGLIVSFEESAEQLRRNALSFGWDLGALEKKGLLYILYPPTGEVYSGESLLSIQDCVEEIGVKRVLVDSINGFAGMSPDDDSDEYVRKTSGYLKSNNITTIFVHETADLLGSKQITENGTSYIMDSVIMLRYVEIESELRRAMSVLKIRGSAHDAGIHEVKITDQGLTIVTDGTSFEQYEDIFSGAPRLARNKAFVKAFGER